MSKTILVVEDSPTQAQRTQLILSRGGYETDLAENGREGLDHISNSRPDMVITDLEMPIMNGYRLCKHLKSDPDTADIPIVMLTSRSDSIDIIKGLEAGADNFITKPYDEYHLLDSVKKIFDNVKQRLTGELTEDKIMLGYQGQIAVTQDRQQILELLFSTINGVVDCDAMGLLLISNADSHLFFQVSKNSLADDTSYEFKKKILSAAVLLCKPEPEVKLRSYSIVRGSDRLEMRGSPQSFASVPLINNSQTIGMLAIANLKADIFDADNIKFLFQLGAEAAQAFDRIQR